MKALLFTAALAFFASATVTAQDTKSTTTQPAQKSKVSCIMADETALASLSLSEDQLTKVRDIQANCRKEHGTTKATDVDPKSVAKYEDQLKAVLTPDQFAKWAQWCDANKAMK